MITVPALAAIEVNVADSDVLGTGLATAEVNIAQADVLGTGFAVAEVSQGDGFLIMADLVQSELSGSLGAESTRVNAKLLINGVACHITSFSYQVPTGKIGSILNARLQGKSLAEVPNGASVTFSLLIDVGSSVIEYPLMTNGKIQSRSSVVSWKGGTNAKPTDEVNFSAIDVIADKFSLSPRRPVIMFDPARVKYNDVNPNVTDAMRDENGAVILPVLEPMYGLTLRQVMDRAYTPKGGLGSWISSTYSSGWGPIFVSEGNNQIGMDFTKVVTNIPNYPVKRADFPVESSWHDGVRPFVDMLAPMFFVEGTWLFVIDIEVKLPYTIGVHALTLGDHKKLTQQSNFKPDQNAIILTYQYSAADPGEDYKKQRREVFTESTDVTGSIGDQGYVRTVTRKWDYEYYMPDNPTVVLDTLPESVDISTYQMTGWHSPSGVMTTVQAEALTHHESIRYEYEGELKVSHLRYVNALIPVPITGNLVMKYREVLNESCEIAWTDDPKNPGTKIQAWSRIDTTGICYVSDEDETIDYGSGNVTIRRLYPALDLAEAGRVTSDMAITSKLQPISSERETLRNLKGSQFEVHRVEINFLSNTVTQSTVDTRSGTTSVDPYETRTRNVLMRDLVSEALIGPRVPISVNAYELPRAMALDLGQRVLKRMSQPANVLPIDIPGVDLVIKQGTIIKGQLRNGSYTPKNFIVTGYSITGENLGTDGHRIFQSLESIELLDA